MSGNLFKAIYDPYLTSSSKLKESTDITSISNYSLTANEKSIVKLTSMSKSQEIKEKIFDLIQNLNLDCGLMAEIERKSDECNEKIKEIKNKLHTNEFVLKCIAYFIISNKIMLKITSCDILTNLNLRKKDYINFKFLLSKANHSLEFQTLSSQISNENEYKDQGEKASIDGLFMFIDQIISRIKSRSLDNLNKEKENVSSMQNTCILEQIIESNTLKEETSNCDKIKITNIQSFNKIDKLICRIDNNELIAKMKNIFKLEENYCIAQFENYMNLNIYQKSSTECVASAMIKYVLEREYRIKLILDDFNSILNHSKFTISKKMIMLKAYMKEILKLN